jgi:hypothetical protein
MTNTRDNIRAGVYKGVTLKREKVTINGAEIEIIQPTVEQVMKSTQELDPAKRVVNGIIAYARIPGTDEKVFDDTDAAALLNLPFSQELTEINLAMSRLMGLEAKEIAKNSEGTSSATTS